ncbi:Sirohydrochlorin ferrochelatase [Paenibacillus sp. UNC496MF]|uniref:sirohydrochlorin chelatase n=1 Tax=Paenibacillus sp. UNC496MF TaxID=1502753 RepID=UPI0008E9AD31|nr:CbiX/SirB N-terminal domain-containing protein [Paenibacillus sp. UNC496MF]SFI70426.1 Sirohydrochlorin ferrochelatase [Paenibacillus sp. UNC496MF]
MKPGILVISHGSREAGWVKLVDDAVAAVAASAGFAFEPDGESGDAVPIASSFLEIVEGRLIQDGIDRLVAEGVSELYVLPLFVSSGSTHADDIAQAFGAPPVSAARPGELAPFRVPAGVRVRMGQPIDDDADIAELLHGNIAPLSEAPARERLLLIAHGSREAVFHGRWRAGMKRLTARLRARGGFAGADIAMLLPDQAACKLRALQRRHPGDAFLVVPLFLSEGYFTRTVIPKRLEGLAYRYNGRALLPNPCIAGWMERQIRKWLAELGAAGDGHLGS